MDAHGKVILLGEHAVVYGVPAIAAGIDRGAHAKARPSETAKLSIGDVEVAPDDGTDLGQAFQALLADLESGPVDVRVECELPTGCGLGSSAAIAVAVARAITGKDSARVQRAATAWEKVFHGNPSGIDVAAAALGGCLWFTRADGASPLALVAPLELAVAIAGPAASTKVMVDSVARLRERRPEIFQKTLDGIHSIVKNGRLAIEAGDIVGLGRLFDLNQMLLAGWYVSTEEIEHACQIAREAGALGAKLTGAGGGGCVIALTAAGPERVLEAWRKVGLTCFGATIGGARA